MERVKKGLLCVKCNKNTAEVYISGKYVCKLCARDEIIRRVRRELLITKFLNKTDTILIIFPTFYRDVVVLITNILKKICKNCNLNLSYLEISDDYDLNKVLWSVVIAIKNARESKIILPFTADFYLAYLIYSSSMGSYYYLYLYNDILNIFNKSVFIPFYNTPITELNGFVEITGELKVKDELFNKILNWSKSNFIDNEIYHSFGNSINMIINNNKNKCIICNALITYSELNCCKYCLASFSHLCSK